MMVQSNTCFFMKTNLRAWLSLIIFTLFSLILLADNDEGIKKHHPYAVPESDVIDLGTLKAGSRAAGEIKLSNRGEKEMLIAKVRSSCGLMIPTWPREPVSRNEEVTIRFRYDTKRLGPFERNVVIHTNAYQKTLVVKVIGEVIPIE